MEINTLLALPVGKLLAEGNWENHVHELGEDFVYKEVKSPECVEKGTKNYENRVLLQKYWNTEVHFENMQKDQKVFKDALEGYIPDAVVCRNNSLISDRKKVIITVQEKIQGTLFKDSSLETSAVKELAQKVHALCVEVFNAPPDFHGGNLMVTDSGNMLFFDTGTPSDWNYFLSASKLESLLELTKSEAEGFVAFMKPVYESHWNKLSDLAGV